MRNKVIAMAAGAALLASASAWSQSDLNRRQEQEVVNIITEVGGTCERVSRTQAVGRLDNNDTLMAVACTGGEQYVILLDSRARMQFYSTCEALAEANNNQVRCFT